MRNDEQLGEIYYFAQGIDQILYDLGGSEFIKNSGCHDFVIDCSGEDPWLRMSIPENSGHINRLEITLLPDNNYNLEFYNLDFSSIIPEQVKTNISSYEHLNGSEIKELFSKMTGIELEQPKEKEVNDAIIRNISQHLENEIQYPNKENNGLKL